MPPTPAKEHNLYATVSRSGPKQPTQVSIYEGTQVKQGMEWKHLKTWTLSEGGVNYDVSKSVLKVAAQGQDEIRFWFQEWFAYVEGRGVLVLHYNVKTGKFEAQVAD